MTCLMIFLGITWIFFLTYDIIHKECIATTYQDALWVVNSIYFIIIEMVTIPIGILCIINAILAISWGISYYLQSKYNTKTLRWVSIVISCLFFVSFIMRIMVIIGAN